MIVNCSKGYIHYMQILGMSAEQKRTQKNIDIIKPETYEGITELAKKQDTSIRKCTNDILERVLKRENFLKDVLPHLEKIGFSSGHLYIKDEKLGGVVATVGLNDKGYVYCMHCKDEACIHVVYSLAMMEVVDLGPLKKVEKKK